VLDVPGIVERTIRRLTLTHEQSPVGTGEPEGLLLLPHPLPRVRGAFVKRAMKRAMTSEKLSLLPSGDEGD
jgi:hypothetical protein